MRGDPTIHKVTKRAAGKEYHRWEVTWYVDGRRFRKSFPIEQEKEAKAFRKEKDQHAKAGNYLFNQMTPTEALDYITAREKIADENDKRSVANVIEEHFRLKNLANPTPLPVVVDQFARTMAYIKPIVYADAVLEYLGWKVGQNLSGPHIRDIRSRLGIFGKFYRGSVHILDPEDVNRFLAKIKEPVTRANFKRIIKAFLTWCRSSGYLPDTFRFELLAKVRPGLTTVDAYTKEELMELMKKAHPRDLPYIYLGAFMGLRSSEIARVMWEDFSDTNLRVITRKGSSPSKRLVPIPDNLRDWVAEGRKKGGRVAAQCQYSKREFAIKKNGFRKSFISYQVAKTGDVARTALMSGNSYSVIYQHYLDLKTKEEGEEWFQIPVPAKIK